MSNGLEGFRSPAQEEFKRQRETLPQDNLMTYMVLASRLRERWRKWVAANPSLSPPYPS